MANMERNRPKNNEKGNHVWKVLLVLCLLGVLVAMTIFGVQTYNRRKAEKLLEDLAKRTEVVEPRPSAIPEKSTGAIQSSVVSSVEMVEEVVDPAEAYIAMLEEKGIPVPEKNVDFTDLITNTNADIYAWIYIPDTKIDYPVVQHPTDNSYYLNYNLDGSKGYPGCIYTEDYNTKDFTDPNTVLYGHNMINGSMFAGLHKYADMQYLTEHPYVYIYTPERMYVYEIFAAYEYSNAHLLLNGDLTSEVVFKNYLQEIREIRSMNYNIVEDIEVTTEDCILTLSTCIKNKPDNRYLVQGVLVNEN